jgi:hypothetical protein
MYYRLISSLKQRLVLELQDGFSKHPVYEKVVPWIQSKFAFRERPQFGIVVKGSSANKVQLSSENFVGTVSSKVMLANVEKPAYLLEWVKEDSALLREQGDVMPIQSGVYILECTAAPVDAGEIGEFVIDPLLTVTDELALLVETGVETEIQLQQPPTQGTLRLWENRRHPLEEGTDYNVDYRTGLVTITSRLARGAIVTADYRYEVPRLGPFTWKWNSANLALPGVILAFGKRGRVGDRVAVVVYDDRVDTAMAYGGRTDVSFDLDIISQDPAQMEEMADYAFLTLWGEKRAGLSSEGLEITDVSMGGEGEESYDENADLFFYTASMSIQIQADWEIHVPLPLTISRVVGSGIQTVTSGLYFSTVPITPGRNCEYERIT